MSSPITTVDLRQGELGRSSVSLLDALKDRRHEASWGSELTDRPYISDDLHDLEFVRVLAILPDRGETLVCVEDVSIYELVYGDGTPFTSTVSCRETVADKADTSPHDGSPKARDHSDPVVHSTQANRPRCVMKARSHRE